jgi:hypothetical protein
VRRAYILHEPSKSLDIGDIDLSCSLLGIDNYTTRIVRVMASID